jgi:hypothetical protein
MSVAFIHHQALSSFDAIYDYVSLSLVNHNDGGIVGRVLDSLDVGMIKRDPLYMRQLFKAEAGEGLLASMFLTFVLAWIILSVTGIVFLCVLHCNRKKEGSKPVKAYRNFAKKMRNQKQKLDDTSFGLQLQRVLGMIFLVMLVIFFAFSCKATADLRNSLMTGANEGRGENVMAKLYTALNHTGSYLENFIPNAIEDTQPIVNQMINATLEMQERSSRAFNKELQAQTGGKLSLELGKNVSSFLLQLFANCPTYVNLTKRAQKAYVGVESHIHSLRRSLVGVMALKDSVVMKALYAHGFTVEEIAVLRNLKSTPKRYELPRVNCNTFLYFMQIDKKTAQSVREDSTYGARMLKLKMATVKVKQAKEMQIPATIRNSSASSLLELSGKLDNATMKVRSMQNRLVRGKPLAKFGRVIVLSLGFSLAIFAVLICGFAFILAHYHIAAGNLSDRTRNRLKLASYMMGLLLVFPVLCSLVFYIAGGFVESQVCRYVRPTSLKANLVANRPLLIDVAMNGLVNRSWAAIFEMAKDPKKKNNLIPKPHNPLRGIILGCQRNAGILDALGAIESLDTSQMSKPAVTERFLTIGRRLMEETVGATDPMDMMKPGMEADLQKAANGLDAFLMPPRVKMNFDLTYYKDYVFYVNVSNARALNLLTRAELAVANMSHVDSTGMDAYFVEIIRKLVLPTRNYMRVKEESIGNIQTLAAMQPIRPTIVRLLQSIEDVKATFANKTSLLKLANDIYDEVIEKPSPANSAKMMAKYGPLMMTRVGYCRDLYEAYDAAIFAVCNSVTYPINGVWFLFTVSSILALISVLFSWSMLAKNNQFAVQAVVGGDNTSDEEGAGAHGNGGLLKHMPMNERNNNNTKLYEDATTEVAQSQI